MTCRNCRFRDDFETTHGSAYCGHPDSTVLDNLRTYFDREHPACPINKPIQIDGKKI